MVLTVFTGGARSGKSSAAVSVAAASGAPVTFVATAEPGDEEMVARIAQHRAQRPSHWITVEAPHDLAAAVDGIDPTDTVVIDCLAIWASNRLLAQRSGDSAAAAEQSVSGWVSDPQGSDSQTLDGRGSDGIVADAARLAQSLSERRGQAVVVTNEVGSGIVPATPLGREFRDLLGAVNQAVVKAADSAYLVVAGRLLALIDPAESLRSDTAKSLRSDLTQRPHPTQEKTQIKEAEQ